MYCRIFDPTCGRPSSGTHEAQVARGDDAWGRRARGGPRGDALSATERRRQELGLNQLRAGEQLGISQAYFSLLERGKVPLSDVSPALRRRLRDWLENGPVPLHAADQATGEPT